MPMTNRPRINHLIKEAIKEIDLTDKVVITLKPELKTLVDRYIDNNRRIDTQSAANAIFNVFMLMLAKDNMRVRFLENGVAIVDVRGMDYD